MDDRRLERIENKVDDLADHLSKIDVTLSAQHESLKHHIKRSDLLESEVKPLKRKIYMAEGALKVIGVLLGLGGLYELLVRVIR